MIGWLGGHVVHQHANGAVVVDVGGVGYEVHVASNARFGSGEPLELFVYTVVRDDAILLYGFSAYREREFFELLLATPGVGPSTALAALRTMTVDELADAIERGDAKRVAQIPGIGLKTAQRIVLELKDKVAPQAPVVPRTASPQDAIDDALRALGYSTQEVREALDGVTLPADESAALRQALALLRRS